MSTLFVFLMLAVGLSCAAIATDELKYMSMMRGGSSWKSWKPMNASAPPKRCCIPNQWEGKMSGFISYQSSFFTRPSQVYDLIEMSFDAVNKRYTATSRIYEDGKQKTNTVINLFNEGRVYVIDNEGTCRTHAVKAPFKPICIGERDRFVAHYTEGLGDELIEANAWILENKGYNVIYFVSAKQCIPLADTFWGTNEGWTAGWTMPFFGILRYIDFSAGIASDSVFKPPSDCTEYNGKLWDHLDGMTKYIFSKTHGGLPI